MASGASAASASSDDFRNIFPESTNIVYFMMDVSGSIRDNTLYHSLLQSIYKGLIDAKRKVIIVGWDDRYRVLTPREFNTITTNRSGFGGTLTSKIAEYIHISMGLGAAARRPIDVVIITDGGVDMGDIDTADKRMKTALSGGLNIVNLAAYIVSERKTNGSVISPFIRGDWNIAVTQIKFDRLAYLRTALNPITTGQYSRLPVLTMTLRARLEIYEKLKTISTMDDLTANYDDICNLLICKTMGLSAAAVNTDETLLRIRNDILQMFVAIRKREADVSMRAAATVAYRTQLETSHTTTIAAMQAILDEVAQPAMANPVETMKTRLLAIIGGQFSTVFDPAQIRTASIARAVDGVLSADAVDLAASDADATIPMNECPVLLTETSDHVMLVVVPDVAIWTAIPTWLQDAIRTNPFMVLHPTITELIRTSVLDHPLSLEAYKLMVESDAAGGAASAASTVRSHATRRRCIALPLGSDEEQIAAANYAIALLVMGSGNIIGNINIWYYAIYSLIDKCDWLQPMRPYFVRQLETRLQYSTSLIGLSALGLPIRTSLAGALMFSVCQPMLRFANPRLSTFGLLGSSSQTIIKILEICHYVIPDCERIRAYCIARGVLASLIADVRTLHLSAFKVKYTALVLDALIQNGEIVLYDEPINDDTAPIRDDIAMYVLGTREWRDKINLVWNLAALIDNESVTMTSFDAVLTVDNAASFWRPRQYVYAGHEWRGMYDNPFTPRIHPATMRPVSYNWQSAYCRRIGVPISALFTVHGDDLQPLGQVFSGYSYFAMCVAELGRYPSVDDFSVYVFHRIRGMTKARHIAVPSFIWMVSIRESYLAAIGDMPVEEFIRRVNASRNREIRLQMEGIP